MGNRRFVHCTCGLDGEKVDQYVERTLCILETRPGCSNCPNSQLEVLFQIRIGDQVVACPRWKSESDRREQLPALGYAFVPRVLCLTEKPFPFCPSCPNSKPSELPRAEVGWREEEEHRKKIELELDEELHE
jgi:hypothetical protein